ncbi:MAG: hypothetical protein ABJE66_10550 [Deltaproteobacteria bacterium]
MSLYWKLLLPARAGQERELETVQQQIDAKWDAYDDANADDEPRLLADIDALKKQRATLALPPETLMNIASAPRLGIDPRAEAWLRSQRDTWAERGVWTGTPPWDDFVAAYMKKAHGMFLQGASTPLAVPAVEAPMELTGPYGLDVSFLLAFENFDEDLVAEAYERHDPAAMLDYKDRLLVSIADTATGELDEGSKLAIGLVVMTANWLEFWAEHGLGFEPIFDPSDDAGN